MRDSDTHTHTQTKNEQNKVPGIVARQTKPCSHGACGKKAYEIKEEVSFAVQRGNFFIPWLCGVGTTILVAATQGKMVYIEQQQLLPC